MGESDDADPLYLERIIDLIDAIHSGLVGWTEQRFLEDRDKREVTAYRLSVIGELTRKLSTGLKARHPQTDWAAMYRLRNIVAHHYHRVDYQIIWGIAATALDDLRSACGDELSRIDE